MNSAVASGSVLEPIANGRRGRRYRLARPLWAAPAVVFLALGLLGQFRAHRAEIMHALTGRSTGDKQR